MKLNESNYATVPNSKRPAAVDSCADDVDFHESADEFAGSELDGTISRILKRAIDLALAATIGALLMPVLVVIAATLKCVSRGPILYGQVRLGQYGRPFRVWKFRTMVEDAERQLDEYLTDNPERLQEWATEFKLKDDPRVIPWVGRALRKSSLDELPQLWNVISGDMSLVGPRPLPQYHLDQFDEDFQVLRETVPPGITGQWQVSSRHDGAPEMFRKWDTQYIRNWSLWLDLKILFHTPWAVLSGTRSGSAESLALCDAGEQQ